MSRDALVVGISSYRWLPDLGAPANDAEAIAQILQTKGDFRVQRMPEIVKNNQTQVGITTPVSTAELEAALVKLFKPKGNNIPHTALFYYSGHGLQKDAGIQEGYLATSDANPEAGVYGLSLFWLRRLLQESQVRQRIVILDCCHSGEILNYLEADPGAKSGTDRLFMAASREYESAYESLEGSHSVFTQALLDGLDPASAANCTVTNYHLSDWVSNALRSEVQQPVFENSGGEIILTRDANATTVLRTALSQDICPYRGLEYFDESHADYFYGREDLTDQLIDKLRSRNFVAVVGASGSGKSSLVRAGLIHRLRLGHQFSGSDRWQIKIITPNDQPFKSLANAFVNPKAPAVERAEQLRRAEIFLDDGNGLSQLVRASLMSPVNGTPPSRMLLVIDQFEEMFTLCQGTHADRDRHRFFNCLLNTLEELNDLLSVVVVLRADFFGKCSLYTDLAEHIEQNIITVTPLTYDQIKASIIKPAHKVGLTCDQNLTYNILRDIVGSPGELPLLQYTLLELWHRREADPTGGPARLTLDAYTELGGVRGTLQKRADEIFYSLAPDEQPVAKRIFIALTQLGDGTEDTRRRILKSELVGTRFPAELVERVIEKLVRAKLVVTNRITPTNRYQERINQGFANVSTALRFAQMRRGKRPTEQTPASTFLSDIQTKIADSYNLGIARITKAPTNHLRHLNIPPANGVPYQETVDVAHETLIRHWGLLRDWLDENRDMLRRQRKIEHAAREWDSLHQPRSMDYLLRGNHLVDAEDFWAAYGDELSAIAQRYIQVSRTESQRSHKELRVLQLSIPCTLLAALVVTLNQYQSLVRSQTDKDYQSRVATSRQQAAVAQSILQDPTGDPTTALLISRLAVEKGERTKEAQESLRAALQKLRLQANLAGHQGAVRRIEFSPNQRQLVTAGQDGVVRLWSLKHQSLQHQLRWQDWVVPTDAAAGNAAGHARGAAAASGAKGGGKSLQPAASPIVDIALSPDGKQLAAIAQNSAHVQVWATATGKAQFRLSGFKGTATRLTFSPRGDALAAVSTDHEVRIWQAKSGVLQTQLRYSAPVRAVEFSPDGQSVLIASGNTIKLMQLKNGQTRSVLHHSGAITDAHFSPDGRYIAAGGLNGQVRIWHTKTAQVFKTLSPGGKGHSTGIVQVLFSPNSQVLATTDQENQVMLVTMETGLASTLEKVAFLDADRGSGRVEMAFSPDGERLVTTAQVMLGSEVHYALKQWQVRTGRALETLQGHTSRMTAVQFSADGALIATAGDDGTTRLWAATGGSELPTVKTIDSQWVAFRQSATKAVRMATGTQHPAMGHLSAVRPTAETGGDSTSAAQTVAQTVAQNIAQARSQGGVDEMLTISANGMLHRWSLSGSGELPFPKAKPQTGVTDHQLSAHTLKTKAKNLLQKMGESMGGAQPEPPAEAEWTPPELAAADDAPAPLVATSVLDKVTPGSALMGVAFSHTAQMLAIADSFGGVAVWGIGDDWQISRIRQLDNPINGDDPQSVRRLAFSADRSKVLGVGDDLVIRVWDVASGKLLTRLAGHKAAISGAEFSPDGASIVSAGYDRTARVWDVASGKSLHSIPHNAVVTSGRFSPDGQMIVTAGQAGTARVIDLSTGGDRVLLAGHRGAVLDAEFSPDGQMIVTASEDGTAKLWDAQTGQEISVLRSVETEETLPPLQKAFFSPDGRYVATLDSNGQLRTWVATWEGLLDLAQERTLRQLKPEECLRYLGVPSSSCPSLPGS
jgi:WD40 repeat protein